MNFVMKFPQHALVPIPSLWDTPPGSVQVRPSSSFSTRRFALSSIEPIGEASLAPLIFSEEWRGKLQKKQLSY
jgi:hypothetical protein